MDVFYQIKVRYFKPLVCKEKALLRQQQGFIISRPKKACFLKGWK
jgi:hypothetical protein